jgi:4-amino-4-deoxy-L-arabinose transferase-like glycosyltransferase
MLRRVPRPLGLLLAVSALLTVAWTFTTAPLQGPDEPAHSNYTQYLAETGHRPSVMTGSHPDSTQTGTALIFMNLAQLAGDVNARPAWSHFEEQKFDQVIKQFGKAGARDGWGPNPLAKNPPLYYAYEAIPYKIGSVGSYWDRLIVMRLASGLLFLITVLCAWLAAAEIFATVWPRLVAAGCVALLPQMTFLSGTVNADNLLVAVWSVFAVAALRLVRRGPTLGRTLAVCGLAILSGLTHGRGLAIAGPLAVALVVAFARARPPWRQTVRWLGAGLGLLAVAGLAYRAFLAPAGGAYGGEVNVSAPGFNVRQLITDTWQFYFPKLPFMDLRQGPSYGYRQVFIESFFGRFATLEIDYPTAVYDLIQDVCAMGLAGLVAAVIARWSAVRAHWPQVAVLVAMTVSMLALLQTASYRALRTGVDPLITGRYLLPLIVVFGCTVAFAVSSLRPRIAAALGTLVLAGLLALNLSGLMLTLARFYG